MTDTAEKFPNIRITMRTGPRIYPSTGEVTLSCLTNEEVEQVEGLVNGMYYVAIENGRLKLHPALEPLPSPTVDYKMVPFWHRANDQEIEAARYEKLTLLPEDVKHHFPSFYLSHVGAGLMDRSFSSYAKEATKLEDWGFQCLRSRRGSDGRFWEVWYLPSTSSAQGELKRVLGKLPRQDTKVLVDAVIDFLCAHSSFGSLDVVIQRAALTYD